MSLKTLVAAAAFATLPAGATTAVWDSGTGYNGHTYITVTASAGISWTDAESAAIGMGGHLASVTSAAENMFIYSLISGDASLWTYSSGVNVEAKGPWLGGILSGSSWLWSDGAPFSYQNWQPHSPDNYQNVETHIRYYALNVTTGSTWDDAASDVSQYPYNPEALNPHGFVVEIVPEPGCLTLVGLGAALLPMFRRMRK